MKPEKKVEKVVLERHYWSCWTDDEGHRHQTEKSAQACIDKHLRSIEKPAISWTPEMYAAVLQARAEGESIKALGARYSMTASGMRSVIARAERRIALAERKGRHAT